MKQHFGPKNPELPKSWKLNGNIFFELFLGELEEKMTSMGYKREQNKTQQDSAMSR